MFELWAERFWAWCVIKGPEQLPRLLLFLFFWGGWLRIIVIVIVIVNDYLCYFRGLLIEIIVIV